jgi:uncharacterized protein (DUF1015 family)
MPRQPLDLAPFRGLRYVAPDVDRFIDGGFDIARLLAPPYDIPDADEARKLQRSDPHNAARVTLPFELSRQAPEGEDALSRRYRAAADLLHSWIAEGVLTLDEEPALYVYEQVTADGQVQRGLLGALGLPEEGTGTDPAVRPHEDVADPPVRDRFRLMDVARANLEPIFLVYRGAGGAASAATEATGSQERPVVSTRTRDGARHRLWAITDPGIQQEITADLAGRSALIADGHHRYAAYLRLQRRHPGTGFDHGLAMLVDQATTPLFLGPLHRSFTGTCMDDIHNAAEAIGLPHRETDRPTALAELDREHVVVTDTERWAVLTFNVPPDTALVELLHDQFVPALPYGPRTVDHHHSVDSALRAAKPGADVAVLMPAPSVELVHTIAEADRLLPEKATSFQPKPSLGVLIRPVDQ